MLESKGVGYACDLRPFDMATGINYCKDCKKLLKPHRPVSGPQSIRCKSCHARYIVSLPHIIEKIRATTSKKIKQAWANGKYDSSSPDIDNMRGLKVKEKYRKYRDMIFAKLGEKCIKCGFNDRRALQIDHVNGGGTKQRGNLSGLTMIRRIYRDNQSNYQILCANCNWIKRHEHGELGHGH